VPQSAPTRAVKCSPHFGRDFSAFGQVLFYCVNPSDSPTPRPKLQLSAARGPSYCFAPYTCMPCKTLLRCPANYLRLAAAFGLAWFPPQLAITASLPTTTPHILAATTFRLRQLLYLHSFRHLTAAPADTAPLDSTNGQVLKYRLLVFISA
jgi:hypothetical protein